MGLLDDAIREHLELKRRGGADPSAVAREEHEALAPVFPDESEDVHEDDGVPSHAPPDAHEIVDDEVVATGDRVVGEASLASDSKAALSTAGQETAELDMQAVLEEDPDIADGGSPVGPGADGPTPAYAGDPSPVDPLELELPAEHGRQPLPGDMSDQEPLSFE